MHSLQATTSINFGHMTRMKLTRSSNCCGVNWIFKWWSISPVKILKISIIRSDRDCRVSFQDFNSIFMFKYLIYSMIYDDILNKYCVQHTYTKRMKWYVIIIHAHNICTYFLPSIYRPSNTKTIWHFTQILYDIFKRQSEKKMKPKINGKR